MLQCIIMMVALLNSFLKASAQCDHGEVRLVNGNKPNEGRVEVCTCTCSWGTVCDDDWDNRDAQVVCRQLGYRSDGASALQRAHFGGGYGQAIVLDDVRCDARETTLLQCSHSGLFRENCIHSEDAGVRCSEEEERLLSISVDIIDVHAVLITWNIQNTTLHWPSLYEVTCFTKGHHIEMSVNNSFSVQLMGLLPSTLYNCCVSAVYESYAFTPIGACIETVKIEPGHSNSRTYSADTIGGVLGCIIAILLMLLTICGGTLVYLLRQKFLGNVIPKVSVDRNSTDVPVRRNVSYATTPSHSTTSGSQAAQATRAAGQSETNATANYSRIGPSYETTDSRIQGQQPAVVITGRNQVSARFSERYEFSDAHLAAAGGSDSAHGIQGDVGMDYEVPQNLRQIEEHEEYSHLQH